MTTKVNEQTEKERAAALVLRKAVESFVSRNGVSIDELARRLGLIDVGVENLFGKTWGLETAWRVAEALGLQLSVDVEDGSLDVTIRSE